MNKHSLYIYCISLLSMICISDEYDSHTCGPIVDLQFDGGVSYGKSQNNIANITGQYFQGSLRKSYCCSAFYQIKFRWLREIAAATNLGLYGEGDLFVPYEYADNSVKDIASEEINDIFKDGSDADIKTIFDTGISDYIAGQSTDSFDADAFEKVVVGAVLRNSDKFSKDKKKKFDSFKEKVDQKIEDAPDMIRAEVDSKFKEMSILDTCKVLLESVKNQQPSTDPKIYEASNTLENYIDPSSDLFDVISEYDIDETPSDKTDPELPYATIAKDTAKDVVEGIKDASLTNDGKADTVIDAIKNKITSLSKSIATIVNKGIGISLEDQSGLDIRSKHLVINIGKSICLPSEVGSNPCLCSHINIALSSIFMEDVIRPKYLNDIPYAMIETRVRDMGAGIFSNIEWNIGDSWLLIAPEIGVYLQIFNSSRVYGFGEEREKSILTYDVATSSIVNTKVTETPALFTSISRRKLQPIVELALPIHIKASKNISISFKVSKMIISRYVKEPYKRYSQLQNILIENRSHMFVGIGISYINK